LKHSVLRPQFIRRGFGEAVDFPPVVGQEIGVEVDRDVARRENKLTRIPRVAEEEPKLMIEHNRRQPARRGRGKRREEVAFRA
jgi:hypothetical protein